MTNPTPHGQVPEALRLADEFKLCSEFDSIPSIIDIEKAEAELRRQHAHIAELEAQIKALSEVQALSAAPASPWSRALEIRMAQGWKLRGDRIPVLYTDTINGEGVGRDDLWLCTTKALAASPTPPAEQQAAPKAAPLQQEWRLVLPGGKHTDEWESARVGDYNRGWNDYRKAAIAALNSVVWPARASGNWVAASTWLRNNYQDYPNITSLCDAMLEAAPQQEAQKPCQTCIAMARTVMMDQVSFDRKPDCYGIRQVTDVEGVEEWEDIRTSPDVAREEANDMMATGRGEIYEVVPLWTTPQPAPAPLSEDLVQKTWALLDELEKLRGADRYDEDWVTLNKRDSELRTALGAQENTP